ncbi:hypothetical protein [Micromonospora sp. NPDC047074]|uniref:hypothetical protein n=1 Tax=Micromonospora sp. NPDC047074 TaxID=3154339 RepID=UPI003400A04F
MALLRYFVSRRWVSADRQRTRRGCIDPAVGVVGVESQRGLRRLMLGISLALERALTFANVAMLILISGYQTPEQIRAAGREQLVAHLRRHRAVNAVQVADQALAGAAEQDLTLPGQDWALLRDNRCFQLPTTNPSNTRLGIGDNRRRGP